MNETSPTEPSYRYRPRLVGGEFVFRLTADALEWEIGRRSGRIPYREIARVRLGYRPTNLAGGRFIAEVWPRQGTKIEIASITQRSLFDFQNQAPLYRPFVAELIRRITVAGAACRFDAGFPYWRWWPALFVAVVTPAAALFVAARALIEGEYALSATIIFLGLIFLWQVGPMIMRNRPRAYDPHSIPADALP
ncbi:MAG TPA: hypothetical protein VKT73_12015 [Xanthobacteraceae bacterium]|nr:hypothetical protein [Xanthobacteraceae bacterium]